MKVLGFDSDNDGTYLGTDVEFTPHKFFCSYALDGYVYHTDTISIDGNVYTGNWNYEGYPKSSKMLKVDLKKYEAHDGAIILAGPHINEDGSGGWSVFRIIK